MVDALGVATQRTCFVETRGRGYVARPTPRAIAAWPVQRYRFEVDDGVVRADPGPLVLPADVDVDGDGKPGTGMSLELDIGRFEVQFASRGRMIFHGQQQGADVAGVVVVLESRQRIVSGLPLGLGDDETPRIERAVFRLLRTDAVGCPR